MKKRWTMRRALLVLCIASVVFALLLQTFLFHQSLRRQIRAESISDHEISLNKMQTDLSNFIHTIRGEMLTIYSEQDLIAAMRDTAEKDSSMKDYYWRSWYFARKRFTKEDQLLAMYLYDTKDHLISSYRYNSVTYPKDIYKAEYDDNSERVYDYVHGKRTDLMISGYYNSAAKKDIVRFVLKLHNYDADRNALGYLVCDINSAALTSIMAKYVDVEQVCLWLQPLNDRVIAMTGEASESQCRIQKQLAKVVQSHYKSGELEQEYDGNYLIQVSQEPPVDQGDLQIFHHIGTQKCQCQRIKYINPLKISNLKSSVQFGKQGKHQTVDCDQYPVTFAPERLVNLSSVNGIPHPCKDRRLCQNHQTRQTKYDKSFIIFSFTHVITSVSL